MLILEELTLLQWLLMGGIPAIIVWVGVFVLQRELVVTANLLLWTFIMLAFGPYTAMTFVLGAAVILIGVTADYVSWFERRNGGGLFRIGPKKRK